MNVTKFWLHADNPFNDGWLTYVLGYESVPPENGYREQYIDGWNMAAETNSLVHIRNLFMKMHEQGHVRMSGKQHNIPRQHSRAMRPKRIAWLVKNVALWSDWRPGDSRAKSIVDRMKAEGLISRTTYWRDIRLESYFDEISHARDRV